MNFKPHLLTPMATNDGRFTDFAPYVPSISDSGVVAFQAALAGDHSGVYTSDGQAVREVAATTLAHCPARCFTSHPDINRAGQVCVYATLQGGGEAVVRVQADGGAETLAAPAPFSGIGPLGPTMNEQGDVAFRATTAAGRACIRVWRGTACDEIAEADDRWLGFDGLPVVNDAGQVVFRAALPGDRQAIFVAQREGRCDTVAVTGDEFEELGRFPVIDDHGTVAFTARRSGGAGVFTVTSGRLVRVVGDDAGFESFRGALLNNAGLVAFYGTPVGGQLGIYTGPDPLRHRLLGLGDPLFDARIVDFALNPVSVNARGQLAIRVALDDQRQFILRADPVV